MGCPSLRASWPVRDLLPFGVILSFLYALGMDTHRQKQLAGIVPTRPSLQEARDENQAKRDRESLKKDGVKWRTTRSGHVIGISKKGKVARGNPFLKKILGSFKKNKKPKRKSMSMTRGDSVRGRIARVKHHVAKMFGRAED